jgi:monoamine oxidase
MNKNQNIIIIGGGLSGLTLAYTLSKQNIKSIILEGSSRLGGRIQTQIGNEGTPLELGATWFSDMHQNLLALLEELGLKKYPQFTKGKSLFQTNSFEPPQEFYVPESESPSFRIEGGTEALINALADKLDHQDIEINCKVNSISQKDQKLIIKTTEGRTFNADKIILCLPPKLAYHSIKFSPQLPEHVTTILPKVQTWMAGSLKFAIEYKEPFWRKNGHSGMLFSHTGPIIEMYDHTNYENNKFGFTGFLNSSFTSYEKSERRELVLSQLSKLISKEASNPIEYNDKVWSDEYVTTIDSVNLRPHQNNGHPIFQNSYMDWKLYFCGTESSSQFPGYMEGAVISAHAVANKILS